MNMDNSTQAALANVEETAETLEAKFLAAVDQFAKEKSGVWSMAPEFAEYVKEKRRKAQLARERAERALADSRRTENEADMVLKEFFNHVALHEMPMRK